MLSKKALDALAGAKTGQGQVIVTDAITLNELSKAGMIGPDNGITRAGSIIQEREYQTRLDEMFG